MTKIEINKRILKFKIKFPEYKNDDITLFEESIEDGFLFVINDKIMVISIDDFIDNVMLMEELGEMYNIDFKIYEKDIQTILNTIDTYTRINVLADRIIVNIENLIHLDIEDLKINGKKILNQIFNKKQEIECTEFYTYMHQDIKTFMIDNLNNVFHICPMIYVSPKKLYKSNKFNLYSKYISYDTEVTDVTHTNKKNYIYTDIMSDEFIDFINNYSDDDYNINIKNTLKFPDIFKNNKQLKIDNIFKS